MLKSEIARLCAIGLLLWNPLFFVATACDEYPSDLRVDAVANYDPSLSNVAFDPKGGTTNHQWTWGLDPDVGYGDHNFKGAPADDKDPFSLGLDPATLVPEGIDLSFFPSFAISDELKLTPSLSYGEDQFLARSGVLEYGTPKQWSNHYGELVRMVGRTDIMERPLGLKYDPLNPLEVDPSTDETGPRRPVPVEVQTYFVNATGQTVDFYPDPKQPEGAWTIWYSSDGTYRLANAGSSTVPDFELKTSGGLTFSFERYDVVADEVREVLAIRYRVTNIEDRIGNFISISYIGDSLRTDVVSGFINSNPNEPIATVEYGYDTRGRLQTVKVPRVNNDDTVNLNLTNTYVFRYPVLNEIPETTQPDISRACLETPKYWD